MMRSETILEFLLVDAFRFFMSFNISVPPICGGAHELMRGKKQFLSVVTLNNLQFLLNGLQPIIGIHGLDRVREYWRLGLLEFSKFVTLLGLQYWLMSLSLLLVGHSLLHGLQHLGLHYQNLLKCWGWRQIVGSIVVFICGTVVSVSHLMIGKRFDTEIDKEKIEVMIPNYMHQGITMIKIFLDN
jgi:hypothetical protein